VTISTVYAKKDGQVVSSQDMHSDKKKKKKKRERERERERERDGKRERGRERWKERKKDFEGPLGDCRLFVRVIVQHHCFCFKIEIQIQTERGKVDDKREMKRK